jgi:hypothetical protein
VTKDETGTLSFVKNPTPDRCPVRVVDRIAWSHPSQCSRRPKEIIQRRGGEKVEVCGFHVGVVRRANEKKAYREARQRRSEDAHEAARVRVRALESLGFRAHVDFAYGNRGYTGGVVLDGETADRLIKRLSQWPRATRE